MAALNIKWESVKFVVKTPGVVTGASADEELTIKWPEIPTLVYVTYTGDGDNKVEKVILASEKVALGTKAFRCVKISPDNAEADALIGEKGSDVPRIILIDSSKEKIIVLEKAKLKTSSLFKQMKSVSGHFYKESLDKLVKAHIKMLTEQDQLSNELKILNAKEVKLEADGKEVKLAKVKGEIEILRTEMKKLAEKQAELWKLTLRV